MNPTIPMGPRPGKRARPIDQVDGTSPSSARPNDSQVKRERSSPPTGRRLVTSGVKRFAPLPRDCLPSCPQYKQNRQEWASRCVKQIEALNLKVERKLIRDDGLIIDWTSHVAVWSDTLRPETLDLAATIVLAHQTNAQRSRPRVRRDSPSQPPSVTSTSTLRSTSTTVDISSTKSKLPVPPRLSTMRRAAASQLVPSPSSSAGLSEPETSSPQKSSEGPLPCHHHHDQMSGLPTLPMSTPGPKSDFGAQEYKISPALNIPPVVHLTNISNEVHDQSMAQRGSSAVEEEMSEMTENYLRRYVQTYEVDRASLASAYSRNASFAYRVHEIVHAPGEGTPTIQQTSHKASTSGPKRTRLEIAMTLLTLPPLHSMDPSSPVLAQINYDMFYLGAEIGMFVICRGMLRDKTVVHSFILQRKEADAEEAAVEGIWPLMATAHQILVFVS